ncbi:MAG: Nitrilase/cyanide hydratase and apolipoprotein N-acyltransferase [Firmicutes bacterium]|nr:Nitrilase/cyanide hydratase and apolipoprotein N-acyltransferase [Bacillota bacterium]
MTICKVFDKKIQNQCTFFIVATTLSAVAYFFSTGIYNYWFLTWLAPIPLLLYALRATTNSAIFASLIIYIVGFSSGILAYKNTIIPVSTLLYGNMMNAVIYTIIVMLFRHVALRKEHWSWSFIFASGWTAFEFIVSRHSPAGTLDSMAYTQIFNLPIIQIASITGILGITFLLMLAPASVTLAWHYRKNAKLCLKAIAIPTSILILILIFGLYRLYLPNQGSTVKVGMASINMTMEEMLARGQQKEAERIISRYIHCIDLLSRAGAEVVLLPEKIVRLNLQEQPKLLELLADTARKNKIMLIAALDIQEDDKRYNSAYLFLPSGETALRYEKQHLLPFSEGHYIAGGKLEIRDMADKGLWGIAICKDMDFEEPSKGYSQAGVNLLFVSALDFKTDSLLHARVAIMRGVEENYAVARAAQWGLLSLTDNKGNIIKMVSNAAANEDVLLIGEIPLGQGKSIYSRFGDWFGYLSGGLLILLILFFFYLDKQNTNYK